MSDIITEERLTDGQRGVRDLVGEQLAAGTTEIQVGGAAGTGKTTMLRMIADMADEMLCERDEGGRVKIAAPTNRAAKILNGKLPKDYRATTLHYLLGARPIDWTTDDIREIELKLDPPIDPDKPPPEPLSDQEREYLIGVLAQLQALLRIEKALTGDPDADTKRDLSEHARRIESDLTSFKLTAAGVTEADIVIVDEASMVPDDLRGKTNGASGQVIWVGDPYQLEPVTGPCWFTPPGAHTLTQVMRQAGDSGVLALATAVRQGNADTAQLARMIRSSDVEFLFPRRGDICDWERLASEYGDKWLTWRNGVKTRSHPYHTKRLNDVYRHILGHTDPMPQPGERLYITEKFSSHCDRVYLTKGDEVHVDHVHGAAGADTENGDLTLNDCRAKSRGFDPAPLDPDLKTQDRPARCVCPDVEDPDLTPPAFCNGYKAFTNADNCDWPWDDLRPECEGIRIDIQVPGFDSPRRVSNVLLDPESILWDADQSTRLYALDRYYKTANSLSSRSPRRVNLKATYAYAGSVHQAQGGEWPNVCIFWDPVMLRFDAANAVKFLYTAITRAQSRVCIVTI